MGEKKKKKTNQNNRQKTKQTNKNNQKAFQDMIFKKSLFRENLRICLQSNLQGTFRPFKNGTKLI